MESAAAIQMTQNIAWTLITKTTRNKTANVAALGAVDMNPTIGAGAPSYTSGVQMWNGAAATLNPSPTNMNATATNASNGTGPAWSVPLIWLIFVDPVAPNISATPYKKNAVANEPSRKYFSEDSALAASCRRKPASTYEEMEEISSAIKIRTSSIADDISAMPTAPKRIRA